MCGFLLDPYSNKGNYKDHDDSKCYKKNERIINTNCWLIGTKYVQN